MLDHGRMTTVGLDPDDALEIAALLETLAHLLEREDLPPEVAEGVLRDLEPRVEWSRYFSAHVRGGAGFAAQEIASRAARLTECARRDDDSAGQH